MDVSPRAARHASHVASILLGFGLTVAPWMSPVAAHHSIAGIYDSSNPVTVDGVVSRFEFVNPHPFVVVTVTDARGRKEDWRLEMDNRFELEAIGMTSRTLTAGDRIVATGSRGRTQRTSLYVRRLDRAADGFWYEQVGSSPRIGGK
jgi:hypothetical protein